MPDPIEGQPSDSPTDTPEVTPGQEPADTPISETDQIIQAAEKMEKPAGSEEDPAKAADETVVDKDKGVDKPPPYDQDPKWKAARAAQKSLDDVLKANEFESIEDLKAAVDSGKTLQELLGDRDANQLIKDAAELKEIKAYWLEQEAVKKEEEEEPADTVERLKREKKELELQYSQKDAKEKEAKEIQATVDRFGKTVKKAVEDAGFEGESAEIAELFLGSNNPFNEVDITDPKAVKEMAKSGAEKLQRFIANVKQQAVDDYAKGKSDLIPITPSDAPAPDKIGKKVPLREGITVEEAFTDANEELIELAAGLIAK